MLNPELLTALYGLGAEIVLTATDARKVEYSLTFAGQREPLALTLPPGHYLFVRVPDAPGDVPGLAGISHPVKSREGERKAKRYQCKGATCNATDRAGRDCPDCGGAGRVSSPMGDDVDCEACEGTGKG